VVTKFIKVAIIQSVMRKVYLLILILCLLIGSTSAQIGDQRVNDSLQKIWQLRYDSIATVKRTEFLKLLKNFPVDSTISVDLRGLQLKQLPDLIIFNRVRTVYAQNNKISKVPRKLLKIDSLVSLNLSNNEIRRIRFQKNSSIKRLDLSENNFRSC